MPIKDDIAAGLRTKPPRLQAKKSKETKDTVRFNVTRWPEFNVNFWAINKNASSTIINHLIHEATGVDIDYEHRYGQEGKRLIQDRRIDRDEALRNQHLNFAVVRHPQDRFESAYRQFKFRDEPEGLKASRKARFDKSWEPQDFLEYIERKFELRKDPVVKKYSQLSGNKHFWKQMDFIPFKVLDKIDYIVKLEELNDKWPLKLIGPPTFIANSTEPQPLPDYDLELLKNLYLEDFLTFNYTLKFGIDKE